MRSLQTLDHLGFFIALELKSKEVRLRGSEIFLFTYNSTTEDAYHNGTLSIKNLFEFVVRLIILKLMKGDKTHLIHISGTRIIKQGTDGIWRGPAQDVPFTLIIWYIARTIPIF